MLLQSLLLEQNEELENSPQIDGTSTQQIPQNSTINLLIDYSLKWKLIEILKNLKSEIQIIQYELNNVGNLEYKDEIVGILSGAELFLSDIEDVLPYLTSNDLQIIFDEIMNVLSRISQLLNQLKQKDINKEVINDE